MSSGRKRPTLDYEPPSQMSVLAKLEPFRWLFWPVGLSLFAATFVGIGGGAVAIYELIIHLPVLTAWLLAAYGWGSLCTKRRLLVVEPATTGPCFVNVTAIAVGLGLMSLATLGLGLVGAMNRPAAIGLVLVGMAVAVVSIYRRQPKLSPHVEFRHWPWLLLTPSLAIVLLCALLPAGLLWGMDEPNGYDVVSYHLQVPREWYEAGRISGLHHNVYSYFPFNVEMHYLLAMHLMGGPWAGQFLAQLMHAGYMGLFVVAVYGAASSSFNAAAEAADALPASAPTDEEKHIRGSRRGVVAALVAAAPPWIPMLGSIAYNEGGLLLYGTLAVGWVMRNDERGTRNDEQRVIHRSSFFVHRYVLSGVMAGLAAGCKLTAVPILLVGIPLAVLITSWRQWKGVAVFVIAGLLTFSPWLIRNAVWTGNPVFPEMQSILGRGHFSEQQSARWHKAHKPRADQQAMSVRLAEFGRQVFADARFAYGVLPLGIVAMLFAIRTCEARLLLILLLILTAFWLLQTHLQGRFFVLAIPIAAIAVAMVKVRPWIPGSIAVLLVLVGTGLVHERLWSIQLSYGKRGIQLMQAVGATEIDSAAAITAGAGGDLAEPVVLVGDGKAFFYQLPMSRLYYRTVFDVDTSDGRPLSKAYTAALPEGTRVILWVDPGELLRFGETYGLPPADAALVNLGLTSPYAVPYRVRH